MQREIKFRGRRADTGEWVYGYYIRYEHMGIVKQIIATDWAQIYVNSHYAIPETVGQYTGLKDKNGQKIYEGDIVKETNANYVWIIEWDDLDFGWSARSIKTGIAYSLCECEFTTIGNIYENPELLQEVE